MMFIDDRNGNSFPPIYSVHLDDPNLVQQNARAFLSNFSIPPDIPLLAQDQEGNNLELRGIANIGFSFPRNLVNSPVRIRVYVLPNESNVFALKHVAGIGPEWVRIGGGKPQGNPIGPYVGYLEVNFPIGDPPIAVG